MYAEEKMNKFLEDLSSKSSTPGGGSAAALAGAVTASVVSFISNLTIGKKKYKDVEAEAEVILEKASKLRDEMVRMIDQDGEILQEILDSYKKGNQEEQLAVAKKAVNFSLDMTEKCLSIMEFALQVSKIGNRMLASDFEVAAYLGDAAVNSSIANVKINLASIKEADYVKEVESVYKDMQKKSKAIKDEIIEIAK